MTKFNGHKPGNNGIQVYERYKMSPIRRAMHAPKLNPPSALMLELDKQAEPLEAELDTLRDGDGPFKPATDRVRELRKLLSNIDAQYTAEFRRINPAWVTFWASSSST